MKIFQIDISPVTRITSSSLLLCLIISSSAFCEISKDRFSQACAKQTVSQLAPIGSNYNYVIKHYGKPKTKQEQETARIDVWIYSGGAIEFKNGLVSRVLCKKITEDLSKDLTRPKLASVQEEPQLNKITADPTSSSYNSGNIDSKGYSDALNELTKVSPNAEGGAAASAGVVSGAPVIPQMKGLR